MIAALGVLGLATPAAAQSCIAPDGTAGLEEYCESVPSPGGDRGPSDRLDQGAPAVPRQTERVLARSADGAALLSRPSRERRQAAATRTPSSVDGPAAEAGVGPRSGLSFVVFMVLAAALLAGLGLLLRRVVGEPEPGGV